MFVIVDAKKEAEVLDHLEEDKFWKSLSMESMKRAWSKEDKVWDKVFKEVTEK